MNEPIVLPPLDAPFVAWLETQPSMEHNLREDLQTIRQCLRGRSHIEFISGRDAAQRVYSMANWAGFLETASFYRTECKAPVFRPGDRSFADCLCLSIPGVYHIDIVDANMVYFTYQGSVRR